jgi:hypothetical protein
MNFLKKYSKLLLILVLLFVIYQVFVNKENFSGWYHRSQMLSNRLWSRYDASLYEKNHVKTINEIKNNEKKVESFTQVNREKIDNTSFKQVSESEIKDNNYGEYNPNKYVLSDYSTWSIAEKGTPSVVEINELENNKYELPETYQKYDPEHVKPKLDAGSGPVADMADAYSKLQVDKYYQDINDLSKRGGNAVQTSDELMSHLSGNAMLASYQ